MTAVYVPLRVSFYDDTSVAFFLFDSLFDVLFFLDIILTFFTAYHKRGGLLEYRHRYIARNYMKYWFWIDILCCFPVQVLDVIPAGQTPDNAGSLKILRLARLPRLWRIVRIVRLIKLSSALKDSKQYRQIIEFFNISRGA